VRLASNSRKRLCSVPELWVGAVWVSLKYVLYLAPSAKCDRIFTECGRTSNTAKVGMKISGVLKGEF